MAGETQLFATLFGYVLGGPFGAFLGSLLAAGYETSRQRIEGPRVTDWDFQDSAYGNGLPRLRGRCKTTGNVIWSTGVIEREHSTEGEGFLFFDGPEIKSYTYHISLAIGFADIAPGVTRSMQIGRVWRDGHLIVDRLNATLTADQVDAQNYYLTLFTTAGNVPAALHDNQLRAYLDSGDRPVDPTVSADVGVNNAPAYRNTQLIVFEQLTLDRNAYPLIEVEFVESGNLIQSELTATSIHESTGWSGGQVPMTLGAIEGTAKFWAVNEINQASAMLFDTANNTWQRITNRIGSGPSIGPLAIDAQGNLYSVLSGTSGAYAETVQRLSHGGVATHYVVQNGITSNGAYGHALDGAGRLWLANGTSGGCRYIQFYTLTTSVEVLVDAGGIFSLVRSRQYMLARKGSAVTSTPDIVRTSWETAASFSNLVTGFHHVETLATDPDDTSFVALTQASAGAAYDLKLYDSASGAVVLTFDIAEYQAANAPLWKAIEVRDGFLWVAHANRLLKYSLASGKKVAQSVTAGQIGAEAAFGLNERPAVLHVGGAGYRVVCASSRDQPFGGIEIYRIRFHPVYTLTDNGGVTLSSIVSEICGYAGLAAGDIDVTALASVLVTGYPMRMPATPRELLEPLMLAYQFDAVESDGKLKFVRRGGALAATIPQTDLAAHRIEEDAPPPLTYTRGQEGELPAEVAVTHLDAGAQLQPATQYARRQGASGTERRAVDLPIVMPATTAKALAETLLFAAHQRRIRYELQVGPKYLGLEPTDIIDVTVAGLTHRMRIVETRWDGRLVTLRGESEHASVYTQTGTTQEQQASDAVPLARAPTHLQMIDAPAVSPAHVVPGLYAAACGVTSQWPGAALWVSEDGGASYLPIDGAVLRSAASIGTAVTALGNFAGGNIPDEINSVDIAMLSGTPVACTHAQLFTGANLALLGDEWIQFREVTAIAGNQYRLSGLLRGRYATERHVAAHAAGERFVIYDASKWLRVAAAVAHLATLRHYKAPVFGTRLDTDAGATVTPTLLGVVPLPPAHLGGGRNAAGDLTLAWQRRARAAPQLGAARLVNTALDEASESYEIEIWADSTYAVLKRTLTSTTPSATYTAAQQTTDFGSTQSTVYWSVRALSATAGDGIATRGTT